MVNPDTLQRSNDSHSKSSTTSCETTVPTSSLMTVDVDYDNTSVEGEIDMSMLLDSGSNYHLTNTHLELTDYIANDDKDSLKLGYVKLGNNSNIPITGYGNKKPFGRMLVVPSLIPKYVISVGLLAKSMYTVEFTGTDAKVKATNGHIVMNAVCSSNNMYWIQNVKRQKPLVVPNLPSINTPVHLYMMNSDRSIETNDDSEISDHEIDHSLVNHRLSSTSRPMNDKNKSRKNFGPPKEPVLQYAPVQSEDEDLNISTSNSSRDEIQGKRRYLDAYDDVDTESSTDIMNPRYSHRPETVNTGYDTSSNTNLT